MFSTGIGRFADSGLWPSSVGSNSQMYHLGLIDGHLIENLYKAPLILTKTSTLDLTLYQARIYKICELRQEG